MILPRLADGFQKQKGDIFGFGDYNESSPNLLSQMDANKLEEAPVHNLAAERSVGFVNYELSRRGAKQLASASAAQVKAKSHDLIEKRPSGSFRQYANVVKQGGRIPEIMTNWNTKQEELKKQGLAEKEISNIAVDRRKNKDLSALKAMGGPFTCAEAVKDFMSKEDIGEKTKEARLYLEVRYARDTALSIPKTSDIFRLMKDHKKLPKETYASNLKV